MPRQSYPAVYDEYFEKYGNMYGVSPDILRGIARTESSFNPFARNKESSAAGMMQFTKGAARDYGVENPHDPEQSIHGAAKFIRKNLDIFDGDEQLAVSAYNLGPGAPIEDLRANTKYTDKVFRGTSGPSFSDVSSAPSGADSDTLIDIPGVGIVSFPSSMSDEDIVSAIKTNILPKYGQAQEPQPTEEQPSKLGAAWERGKGAFSEQAAGIGLGLESALGKEEAAQKQMEAIKSTAQEEAAKNPPSTQFQDIQNTYEREGLIAAAKQFPEYVAEKALESAPSSAAPLAVGMAATPFVGPVGGAIAGAATAVTQMFGEMMQRQALEKENAGELEPGKAALTAIPAGLLDYAVNKFTVDFPNPMKEAVKAEAIKQIGKHMATSSVLGAGTEAAQQAAERYQAGLPMLDEQALQEYKESAIAGGLLEGALGGVGAGYKSYVAAPSAPSEIPENTQEDQTDITAATPQAREYNEELAQKDKAAQVESWVGSNRNQVFKDIMDQDFTTAEGLRKVEELLQDKQVQLTEKQGERVHSELQALKDSLPKQEQPEAVAEQPAAPEVKPTAPEVQPTITDLYKDLGVGKTSTAYHQSKDLDLNVPEQKQQALDILQAHLDKYADRNPAWAPKVSEYLQQQAATEVKPQNKIYIPEQEFERQVKDLDYPSDDKTRGGISMMTPDQFLALAEESEGQAEERAAEYGDFDVDKFAENPLPALDIDSDGNVSDHEGRARAILAKKAGMKEFPVVVRMPKADRVSYDTPIPTKLTPQGGGDTVKIPEVSHLNYAAKNPLPQAQQQTGQPNEAEAQPVPSDTTTAPVGAAQNVGSSEAPASVPSQGEVKANAPAETPVHTTEAPAAAKEAKPAPTEAKGEPTPSVEETEAEDKLGTGEDKLTPTEYSRFEKAITSIMTLRYDNDFAILRGIELGARKMGVNPKTITKIVRACQTSQTKHAANTAAQAAKYGDMRFDPSTEVFMAVDADNVNTMRNRMQTTATELNMPVENVREVFNVTAEAMRIAEIHNEANKVLATAKELPNKQEREAYLDRHKKTLELAKNFTKNGDTLEVANSLIDSIYKNKDYKHLFTDKEPAQQWANLKPALFGESGPYAAWQTIRKNGVRFLVDTGRLSERDAEALLDRLAYIPFFRVMENKQASTMLENIFSGKSHGLLDRRVLHKIKGSTRDVDDMLKNIEHWQAYMYAMGIKNHKSLQLIDNAMRYMGKNAVVEVNSHAPDAVMVYRHGKKEYYRFADPYMAAAFTGMQSVTTGTFKFLAKYGDILRKFIVRNPLFTLAQLPQDTYAAMYTSGLRHPFALPAEVVKQFVSNVRGMTTHERNRLNRTGLLGLDYSAQVVDRELEIALGIQEAPKNTFDKLMRKFDEFSSMGDAAIRQAVYKRTMAELKDDPHAEAIAINRAAEIINFRRRGASNTVDMIRQITPFYGAYLQAQRVALLTLSGKGISPTQRSEAYKTLASTTTQMMLMSFLYAALTGDDEEIQKMSPDEKDGKLFPIGGKAGLSIPLRKDWTLIPHLLVTHGYDNIVKQSEDPETTRKALSDAVISAVWGNNSLPAVVRPIAEVAFNHDLFTGREVVSPAYQGLEKWQQYNQNSSELGKLVGETGIMNAIQFDHVMRGLFGYVGGGVLSLTNGAARFGLGMPYTEKSWWEAIRTNAPGMSSFMAKEEHSGNLSKFYDLERESNNAIRAYNKMEPLPERQEAYEEEKGVLVDKSFRHDLASIQKDLKEIKGEEVEIQQTPNNVMPPAEKRKRLEELRKEREEVLADIQSYRNEAYRKTK